MAVVWLHPPRAGAVALGLMGGLIATYSAAGALVLASGTPLYDARQGLGWLALGLALLGAGAALLSGRRPRAAGAAMVAAALIGFGAINVFYINTWYGLGAALLAAAGFWALAARGS
jgi:hypothetical protein